MTAPELSAAERATVDRFDAAEPAPESAVERVAAAMFEAIADRPWSQAGPLDRDGCRIEARAAIDAMKGSTEANGELIAYLQCHRRATLRALRASTEAGADYWRWQGHAELSRQLLERLGAEVPR